MSRLTFIIILLLFTIVGYVAYLAKLALEESKKSRHQFQELAVRLAEESNKEAALTMDPIFLEFTRKKQAALEKQSLEKVDNPESYRAALSLMTEARLRLAEAQPSPREASQAMLYLLGAEHLLEPSPHGVRVQTGASLKTYKVGRGETLWGISKKLYQTPWRWHDIWKVNSAKIPVYKKMPAGTVLKLPG